MFILDAVIIIRILFDWKQDIVGGRIRTYLLERCRLVFQPEIECNYHIFYQLCAGAPLKEWKDLVLDTDITKFFYLKQGGPSSTPIPNVDGAAPATLTRPHAPGPRRPMLLLDHIAPRSSWTMLPCAPPGPHRPVHLLDHVTPRTSWSTSPLAPVGPCHLRLPPPPPPHQA
ncbi:myosin head-domain-containing protein [Gautieria morchelliformis]|nr:myosin head-domain-containing protein [Gautieria morchelliformis]